MGFLAAVAALVCVARFNSASPMAGTGYELDAIGACFIGGASAYGGVGTVGGAVIGAIFMGVLNNGMSILGIDANWQKAVKGLVLPSADRPCDVCHFLTALSVFAPNIPSATHPTTFWIFFTSSPLDPFLYIISLKYL